MPAQYPLPVFHFTVQWGGTRIGVYSDDVADGINYGVGTSFADKLATSLNKKLSETRWEIGRAHV